MIIFIVHLIADVTMKNGLHGFEIEIQLVDKTPPRIKRRMEKMFSRKTIRSTRSRDRGCGRRLTTKTQKRIIAKMKEMNERDPRLRLA